MSGAWIIDAKERWLDIRSVRTTEGQELIIRRLRPLAESTVLLQGLPPSTPRIGWLRLASLLSAEAVTEAAAHVDVAVVEAMLVESRRSFQVDSDLLLELAEQDVPDEIIDLMVALSHPAYFIVNEETGEPTLLFDRIGRSGATPYRYGYAFGPGPGYGYGYGYYPYDWGYFYNGYHGYHGIPPAHRISGGGVAVRGRGYTRVQPSGLTQAGLLGALGGSGGGGGTTSQSPSIPDTPSAVTPSGHSGSSSTPSRRAKRR
jgi:hypothetical protein